MTTVTPPPSTTSTTTPVLVSPGEVPLAVSSTTTTTVSNKGLEFRLKVISFFRREVVILCQNENGPCPLLAIVNVLLLQGRLHISTDRSYLSLADLNQLLAEVIIEESAKRESTNTSTGGNLTFQHHLEDVLHVIPKLAQGLDLNVYFNGVNKYEFTQEISIFDTLSIHLLHGWIYDDNHNNNEGDADAMMSELIASQSYNHLMFTLVEYKSFYDKITSEHPNEDLEMYKNSLKPEELDLLTKGAKIEHFLNLTASQLTYKGLLKLYDFMNDRQLAVFFRNNHFSTIFCYQGQLFLLLTDLGFSDQPDIVWELLEGVDGKSDFFTSDFQPISSLPSGIIQSGAVLLGQVGEIVGNAASSLAGTIAAPPKNHASSSKKTSDASPITEEQLLDTTESPMHAMLSQSAQKSAVLSPPPPALSNSMSAATEPNSGASASPPAPPVSVSSASPPIPTTSPEPVVDSDLMLAMQLQQQFDRELNSAPSSSSPSSPTVVDAYGVYVPQSTSENMSQEEYDRQAALMLHYQEVQQAQAHAHQQQQRKSSNCIVS